MASNPQKKAETASQLRIVMFQLARDPNNSELTQRAEELTRQLRELRD